MVVAGGKYDFTAKWWDTARSQQVIDHFQGRLTFAQCGEAGHWHPRLNGVIDLTGPRRSRSASWLATMPAGPIICSAWTARPASPSAAPAKTLSLLTSLRPWRTAMRCSWPTMARASARLACLMPCEARRTPAPAAVDRPRANEKMVSVHFLLSSLRRLASLAASADDPDPPPTAWSTMPSTAATTALLSSAALMTSASSSMPSPRPNSAIPSRSTACCLMPNHFHLVLQPETGQSISRILQSLTVAHTWHFHRAQALTWPRCSASPATRLAG